MSKTAKKNAIVKIFCVILMVCMFLSVANAAFALSNQEILGEKLI